MSTNDYEIQIESEFNKLNISDKDSNPVNIDHENCYKPEFPYNKPWCKECVPYCIMEIMKRCTSENNEIDEFIKDTIYNAKTDFDYINDQNRCYYPLFLELVPFDRFELNLSKVRLLIE